MPMIRAMAQIEQDISDLEKEVVAIAQELSETYDEYLLVLGDSVQRQLILASYHLCTQGYPEQFLKLPPEQRRTLQQSLQRIAKQAREHLNRPSRLAELTQPFMSDLDGIDESSYEDDATLKKLTAIVQRVMNESNERQDRNSEDQSGSEGSTFGLDLDSDHDEDDHFDADLETLVISDDLDDDFLGDSRLTISEFSFDELAESESDDTDWDDEAEDEWEPIDATPTAADETRGRHPDTNSPAHYSADEDALGGATAHGETRDGEASLNNSSETAGVEHSETAPDLSDQPSTSDISAETTAASLPETIAAIPPPALPDGTVGGSSDTVPPTLDLGLVEAATTITPPPPVPVPATPKALARRCDRLEAQIISVIKQASSKANALMHKSGVLPKKLPGSVLEAAMKADLSTDVPDTPPNMLNLLVETGRNEKQPKLMRVMALRLRLSELEFHVPTLMAWRSRIRELAAQIHKFNQDYQKLQRELAIAEAESAWRSTWYELEDS